MPVDSAFPLPVPLPVASMIPFEPPSITIQLRLVRSIQPLPQAVLLILAPVSNTIVMGEPLEPDAEGATDEVMVPQRWMVFPAAHVAPDSTLAFAQLEPPAAPAAVCAT